MSRRSAEIWLQFRGDAPALGALVLLGALAVVALFAPWVAPYDPDAVDFADRFATPSLAHWLGTDDLGRDLLSRLFYGTRVSLRASFQVVITALTFSIPIGLVAGYLGGRVDDLLMLPAQPVLMILDVARQCTIHKWPLRDDDVRIVAVFKVSCVSHTRVELRIA